MKSRIPLQNRLDPEIMAIIEELSQKKAQAKVDEMQAERDEITIRKVLKAVIVRCNSLFGIGAERALRLIEAVNTIWSQKTRKRSGGASTAGWSRWAWTSTKRRRTDA